MSIRRRIIIRRPGNEPRPDGPPDFFECRHSSTIPCIKCVLQKQKRFPVERKAQGGTIAVGRLVSRFKRETEEREVDNQSVTPLGVTVEELPCSYVASPGANEVDDLKQFRLDFVREVAMFYLPRGRFSVASSTGRLRSFRHCGCWRVWWKLDNSHRKRLFRHLKNPFKRNNSYI